MVVGDGESDGNVVIESDEVVENDVSKAVTVVIKL